MSEVLYRKYRPETFKEVIGQGQVVDVLDEAIKSDNISHAYLLTGTRGIGKTTIARIIARELGTDPADLYELDAASNNGVDEIRAINEAVHSLPFNSKYKVYIFDEVHMLSKGAFNALLKTLEEPPKHVIFILATTELEKVPETIISRCQVFTLKKPTETVLAETVLKISKQEDRSIDPDAADLIALLGDGSFRDTLGILQKVLSASTKVKVTHEDVEKITGAPQSALVWAFIEATANVDAKEGFGALETASAQNLDMQVFLKLIIMKLRTVLRARAVTIKKGSMSEYEQEQVEKILGLKSKHMTSKTLTYFLDAYSQMRDAVIPTLPIELALLKVTEE